jgi:hypothetical protein
MWKISWEQLVRWWKGPARPATRRLPLPPGPLETWRSVWQDGIVPLLPTAALDAICDHLDRDSPELLQCGTVHPHPIHLLVFAQVEAACPVALGLWKAHGFRTCGEVEAAWNEFTKAVTARLRKLWTGDQLRFADCKWFTAWWDSEARDVAVAELREEAHAARYWRRHVLHYEI